MRFSSRLLSIAVLSAFCVAGCASSVRISELKAQPDKYERKTVSITGTVTDSYGIPFLPLQLYSLISETGSDFPAAAALALLITAACAAIMATGEWVSHRHERHL